jgi:hypothetical protein
MEDVISLGIGFLLIGCIAGGIWLHAYRKVTAEKRGWEQFERDMNARTRN